MFSLDLYLLRKILELVTILMNSWVGWRYWMMRYKLMLYLIVCLVINAKQHAKYYLHRLNLL